MRLILRLKLQQSETTTGLLKYAIIIHTYMYTYSLKLVIISTPWWNGRHGGLNG